MAGTISNNLWLLKFSIKIALVLKKDIIIKRMWKTKRIEDLVINDNYDSFDNFEKFFDLSPTALCSRL
jgi:hypothetical protein